MPDSLRSPSGQFLPQLDWHPVSSTNVKEIAYLPEEQELHVLLNGGYYIYEGVPNGVLEDFLGAESAGRFLNQNIKPVYSYRRGG